MDEHNARLQIFDGTGSLLAQLSGTDIPEPMTIRASKATMHFTADCAPPMKGFLVQIKRSKYDSF